MRKIIIVAFTLLLFFVTLSNSTSAESLRIAGKHRYETAVNISKSGWLKADTVVLAIGENFPDALAGGPLAYKLNAPILLTKNDELGWDTNKEIKRLGATKVVILGSTGVITKKVESELRNLGVRTIERLGGKDRYATAALIANKLGTSEKAIVAYGNNFPDALAIAPYAARKGYPILLSKTNELPAESKKVLRNVKETIFVGGKSILSDSLLAHTNKPRRIAGSGRYETGTEVVKQLQPNSAKAYIATGINFADALTGSVLAAKNNGVVLLAQPKELPNAIKNLLNTKSYISTTALGGKGVISDEVLSKISSLVENNTLQKASTINVNQSYTAKLKNYSDEDYYKIKLDKPGNITIQVNQMPEHSWEVSLTDKNGKEYEKFTTEYGTYANGKTNNFVGLPAGEYYLNVDSHDQGYENPYTFSVKYVENSFYEKEFNNTISTANTISVNQDYRGGLQNYNDLDYYKVSINDPGNIEIKVDQKANMSWNIKLINQDGKEFASFMTSSSNTVSGPTSINVGLPKGTYYLKLEDNYNSASIDSEYKFQLKYTKSNYYEREFNDSISAASSLELNKNYVGYINIDTRDADFYKINLPQDGKVNVNVKQKTGASWKVEVLDSSGEVYSSINTDSSDYASGDKVMPIGLPAGEYYLKITDNNYDSVNIPYQFTVEFNAGNNYEKEINNSAQQANKINFATTYGATMQDSYDNDFYAFTLEQRANVKLSMKSMSGGAWIYSIINSSGQTVAYIYTDGSEYAPEVESITSTLNPGTYYIKVEDSYSTGLIPYTFKITK